MKYQITTLIIYLTSLRDELRSMRQKAITSREVDLIITAIETMDELINFYKNQK